MMAGTCINVRHAHFNDGDEFVARDPGAPRISLAAGALQQTMRRENWVHRGGMQSEIFKWRYNPGGKQGTQ